MSRVLDCVNTSVGDAHYRSDGGLRYSSTLSQLFKTVWFPRRRDFSDFSVAHTFANLGFIISPFIANPNLPALVFVHSVGRSQSLTGSFRRRMYGH